MIASRDGGLSETPCEFYRAWLEDANIAFVASLDGRKCGVEQIPVFCGRRPEKPEKAELTLMECAALPLKRQATRGEIVNAP